MNTKMSLAEYVKAHPETLDEPERIRQTVKAHPLDDCEQQIENCKQWLSDRLQAGAIITDILKGLDAGKNLADLFLLAVQAVAILTNDTAIQEQAEQRLKTLYAHDMGEPSCIQHELQKTRKRLDRLQDALSRADDPAEHRQIENAIQSHQDEINRLESLLNRA